MDKTQRAARDGAFAVHTVAVVLLALFTNASVGDYADDVCYRVLRGTIFGIANLTATDGNILSIRYECSDTPIIQACASAIWSDAKIAQNTTGVVIADVGARFYTLSCRRLEKPTIEPVAILAKLCNDEPATTEEKHKSTTGKQQDAEAAAPNDVVDAVQLPSSANIVNVSYTVSCFDKPGVISCSFAGGNRLRRPVTIAQGNSGYMVQDGSDYSLTCNKLAPASINPVTKKWADELCKTVVSTAWDQTVKSDYSIYPTGDQLILTKEDTLTVDKTSIPIVYEVQCFGEPVQVQQCIYTSGSRLRDTITITPGGSDVNAAYILQDGKEFVTKCYKFSKALILAKKEKGADRFCEDAIQLKMKEKKAKGTSFSLNEKEVTTGVLPIPRPGSSFRKKTIDVQAKALCFGNRPVFQSCQMKRKGSDELLDAGIRGPCHDIGLGVFTYKSRLDCDWFDMPRFTTKEEKRCH